MKPRKSFPLRLNPELYQAIEAWAQQEMRSVNGQIEFLLKEAVDKRRGKPLEPAGESEPAEVREAGSSTPLKGLEGKREEADEPF